MFSEKFNNYKPDWIKNGVKLPKFIIDKHWLEKYNLDLSISNKNFLLNLIKQGLIEKNISSLINQQEYQDRVDQEFRTFEELGLIDYVLITWEIIAFCKENKIATGMGRGSAAGCLIFFLIGVTEIDSLKNGCYFERFLNRSRCKFKEIGGIKYYDGSLLMDCDLDISMYDRQKVIQWLEKRYERQTAKLLTVSTLTTKILLKEVVKCVLDMSEEEANHLSEMVPKIFGVVKSIDASIEASAEFAKFAKENPKIIESCKKLANLNKNFGVHPSAVIISADKIEDVFPLQFTKEKELVTGYTMDDALTLAVKEDILGLRTCSLLHSVSKMTEKEIKDIDLEDEFIYQQLQDLKAPHGLFQIEAECNLRVTKQFKPKNLNHLAAVVACARPGGLEFVNQFAEFIETGKTQSIHPIFDNVLKDTAGIPIYQESQLRMLNKIGFSLEESEVCRRVLGKKKVEEVDAWKEKIRQKCKNNNLDEKIAEIVCEVIQNAASYSFNFCLSPDTIVERKDGDKMMFELNEGDKIKAYDVKNNKDHFVEIQRIYPNQVELFEIELEDGRKIKASMNHKFLCEDKKMYTLEEILLNKYKILTD